MDSAVEQTPFASPQIDLASVDPLATDLQDLPSRARRLFAALIDFYIVQVAVNFSVLYLKRAEYARNNSAQLDDSYVVIESADQFWQLTFVATVSIILSTLFYFLFDGYLLYARSQTIGKALFRMKIVGRDGSRAGLMRLVFVRYVPFVIYGFATIFAEMLGRLGLTWLGLVLLGSTLLDPLFIFTKEKRCLHDYLANTIVVKANPK